MSSLYALPTFSFTMGEGSEARVPSLTSALAALFLLCLCVCPNFYFCSAQEIGGSNTGAALPAKQPCPF